MNDSGDRRRGDKRERLVAGARDLLHRQGVQATTLAHVAAAAEVPLGNVYYYFKTKDELVGAVITGHADQVRGLLETLERHRAPRARLKGLVRSWTDMRDLATRFGCPLGSLCSELGKGEGGLDREAAEPLRLIVDWAEAQFRQMGRRDGRDLAVALLAGIQGSVLLASAFRDPDVLTRQGRHLERWIDSLA